jgi:hypothetical protein
MLQNNVQIVQNKIIISKKCLQTRYICVVIISNLIKFLVGELIILGCVGALDDAGGVGLVETEKNSICSDVACRQSEHNILHLILTKQKRHYCNNSRSNNEIEIACTIITLVARVFKRCKFIKNKILKDPP